MQILYSEDWTAFGFVPLDLLVKEDDRLIANYRSKGAAMLFANLGGFSDLFITYDRLSVFLRRARR
jgi:hypothetical protein